MSPGIHELKRLSKAGTRLWILKELRSRNANAKIKPAYTMEELINLFEENKPRQEILDAMMRTTNGDLAAACNLEDCLTAVIAEGDKADKLNLAVLWVLFTMANTVAGTVMGIFGGHGPVSWPGWKFRLLLWGSTFLVVFAVLMYSSYYENLRRFAKELFE